MMHAEAKLDRVALIERWRALVQDSSIPDFSELDQHGELIVNPPPSPKHQRIGRYVLDMLERALGPGGLYEVAVVTEIGVRAPDVVWMPPERWAQADLSEPLSPAPDICVEVLSPGNRASDIEDKTDAYLGAGAKEVIVVSLAGAVEFFGREGQRAQSTFGLTLKIPKDLL